jgi:hypothetical protein
MKLGRGLKSLRKRRRAEEKKTLERDRDDWDSCGVESMANGTEANPLSWSRIVLTAIDLMASISYSKVFNLHHVVSYQIKQLCIISN